LCGKKKKKLEKHIQKQIAAHKMMAKMKRKKEFEGGFVKIFSMLNKSFSI
jgi:hypothetical protein